MVRWAPANARFRLEADTAFNRGGSAFSYEAKSVFSRR